MSNGRDEQGRFLKGDWKGGPGRATKQREENYRTIFSATITPEKFQASCHQVWLDSVGKKLNAEGKLLDDPNSTPASRVSAFARLANYVLGNPIQPVLVENSVENEILTVFKQMSEEQLQAIIDNGRIKAAQILDEHNVSATAREQLALPQTHSAPITSFSER